MKIGVIADMHGDLVGFEAALRIIEREGASQLICAGDIVDRGPEADEIIRIIRQRGIPCIRGNHDVTVVRNQAQWRASDRPERLSQLGRIVSDEAIDFLNSLPETLALTRDGVRLLIAHGTPWSDAMTVFPDSRQGVLNQIVERCGQDHDVIVLGHTHQPMRLRVANLWIFNPGSIYGVTIRDSHTCAVLDLATMGFHVFDVRTGDQIDINVIER
jgi:putative phosphoesterase